MCADLTKDSLFLAQPRSSWPRQSVSSIKMRPRQLLLLLLRRRRDLG